MKKNKELWGIRFELAGLIIILFATMWQNAFTDWWDVQLDEGKLSIQEEVNLAILDITGDIARLVVENDIETRRWLSKKIYERVNKASISTIKERKERLKQMSSGQAASFNKIRIVLFWIGAALFATGKWIALTGIRERV